MSTKKSNPANPYILGAAGLVLVAALGFAIWQQQLGLLHRAGPGMMDHAGMDHGMMMAVASDQDFVVGMIPHHQEAVDSSRAALATATDPDFRAFLQGVIDAQSAEISQMKGWHRDWFGGEYDPAASKYAPMMPDFAGMDSNQIQASYLRGMIMHHRMAISMAEQILPITQRPELRAMAEAIIATQSREISQMQSWLGESVNK